MPQIAPQIASAQSVYDFMNISAAQAATNLPNGTTTVASYIATLLERTAVQLVAWIDHDYTTTQTQYINTMGNDLGYMRFDFPIASVSTFKSWSPLDPTATVVDEGTGNIAVVTIDPYTIIRTDKKMFDAQLEYYIVAVQALEPHVYGGWPRAILQIQCEMIALLMRESSNGAASIGKAEFETINGGRALKYLEMEPIWLNRLRPFRKISI